MTTATTTAPAGTDQATIVAITVNILLAHTNAHPDEAFGIWCGRKHGMKHFPGIDTAVMKSVDKSPELTDAEYDAKGILPFGCGMGRFDDHCATGRLPNTSTAMLVMRYLGVTDKATLAIGNEVHWCDTNAGVLNTQLAELVKAAYRTMPGKDGIIMPIMMKVFEALYEQLTMNYSEGRSEHGALNYFESYVKSGIFKDPAHQKRVRTMLQKSAEAKNKPGSGRTFYTDLDFIVRAMQRTGVPQADIGEFMRFAFTTLEADLIMFDKALEGVDKEKNQFTAPAKSGQREGNLQCVMVHTDNRMTLRAANWRHKQLTVIRNSKGQVQIFIDRKTGLTLDTVMAMIRWMETPVHERTKLNWHDLATTSGSHPTAPHWYYNREHAQIFNGSDTHPGEKATELASQAFIEINRHAFHPANINKWQFMHGVKKA